jgi:hypothetical protein
MSLSAYSKKHLTAGLASKRAATEVESLLNGLPPGAPVAHVAAVGALPAVGGAVDPTAALVVDVDARILSLQAKVDELLAAMVAAGVMSP